MSPRGGGVDSQLLQVIAPPTVNPWLVPSLSTSGGRWVTAGGVPRVTIARSSC